MEGPEAAAAVIEDAVEDDAHAAGMGLVEQLAQGLVAAQQGVDVEVVVGVIAVIGGGGEHGVQVQRRDAQAAESVEVGDDSVEVAALEAMWRRWCLPGLQLARSRDTTAARKAVGEDLVEDGIAGPGRDVGSACPTGYPG